jgi:hypothetical protein
MLVNASILITGVRWSLGYVITYLARKKRVLSFIYPHKLEGLITYPQSLSKLFLFV